MVLTRGLAAALVCESKAANISSAPGMGSGLGYVSMRALQVLEQTLLATAARRQLQGESLVLIDVAGSIQAELDPQSEATHALLAAVPGLLIGQRMEGPIWDHRALPMPCPPETLLLQLVVWALVQRGRGQQLG